MKASALKSLAAGSVLVAISTIHAALIDFESLEFTASPGDDQFQLIGSSYTEEGFRLEAPVTFANYSTDFINYPGSTAIYNNTPGTLTELNHILGNPFDLLSIDLSRLSPGLGDQTVTFEGTFSDSSIITEAFTTTGDFGLQTFSFTGFENVVSVSWEQAFPFHQFDNIEVVASSSPISSVPEPASFGSIGVLVIFLTIIYRRFKRR
ncbi:MAG: PEP-CTERM sorting domain-containing protein [Symploca sp. SIO2D2]|nr:PEP-CTERM sorting domain-containing protein [Symploca sp. SIO2D2]